MAPWFPEARAYQMARWSLVQWAFPVPEARRRMDCSGGPVPVVQGLGAPVTSSMGREAHFRWAQTVSAVGARQEVFRMHLGWCLVPEPLQLPVWRQRPPPLRLVRALHSGCLPAR